MSGKTMFAMLPESAKKQSLEEFDFSDKFYISCSDGKSEWRTAHFGKRLKCSGIVVFISVNGGYLNVTEEITGSGFTPCDTPLIANIHTLRLFEEIVRQYITDNRKQFVRAITKRGAVMNLQERAQ